MGFDCSIFLRFGFFIVNVKLLEIDGDGGRKKWVVLFNNKRFCDVFFVF